MVIPIEPKGNPAPLDKYLEAEGKEIERAIDLGLAGGPSFCDYCDEPRYPCRETSAIGPIWTRHGGQPWACEECYEHMRQRDIKVERFKKRFKWALWIIAGLIAIGIWSRW
jgi:hypothetical protein